MAPAGVVHIAGLHGGGVDRHVRDIAASSSRAHVIWHVSERAEAIEVPGERHAALDSGSIDADGESMVAWLRSRGVGVAHIHSLAPRARDRAALLRRHGLGLVATLHDVLFVDPGGFARAGSLEPDSGTLAENGRFLATANAVIAPSAYISDLARRHLPAIEVRTIPNGTAPWHARSAAAREDFLRHPMQHVVAVLGAVGPHKGSDTLEALAALLEGSGIGIVVIGYLDRQVVPGWRREGTYFVHGSWQDDELPALFAAYGVEIALFPNVAPESFSYTLSDAWSCGIPVLAAPRGALAERIQRHGGGWLLPEGFDAAAMAAALNRLLVEDRQEVARVKSQLNERDPARIPDLASMARSLDALYDRFALPPQPGAGDARALERLIATNLDGSLFRAELARTADELAQARASIAELEQAMAEAREFEAGTREWIAKLEGDVAALTADVEREVAERRRLAEENATLQDHKAALERVPSLLRRYLLKKIRDARS